MTPTTNAPQLTGDQLRAVQAAMSVIDTAGHMSLIGPAGCGKTTTIRAIATAASDRSRPSGVLLLAPTHKARRQLQAGQLPRGTKAWTVAKFCNVKQSNYKDNDKFTLSNSKFVQTVESVQSEFCLVIVDESSMVSHEMAAKILEICQAAEVGVIFSGDPYQLPPVKKGKDKTEVETDGPDIEECETEMAREFIDAPVKIELTKVLRHDGPILQHATHMRNNWGTVHGFPVKAIKTEDSEIEIVNSPLNMFVDHFTEALLESRDADDEESQWLRLYSNAPRALCYRNSTVADVTRLLRYRVYGEKASRRWTKGEIIMFPSYVKTDTGLIYSSTDAVVINSTEETILEEHIPIAWKTEKRGIARESNLKFSAVVQRLEVLLIEPDGTVDKNGYRVVYCPIIGDKSASESYKDIKNEVDKIRINGKRLENDSPVWSWVKGIKDKYLTRITSAFAMTVHKSQGSTFRHVYVSLDLLYEEKVRNQLIYVATTRASKTVTFKNVNA